MDDGAAVTTDAVPLPGETPADCIARIGGMARIRRVSFGDGEMVWRIWGEGRPVVFLHGGYGGWTHWIRNVLPLSCRFQVIAGDLPAHGEADDLPCRPTRERMAAVLARCLAGALPRDGPYDLVGFSMGANLSAAAIAAYGRNPDNLLVVGPGGLGVASQKIRGLRKWRPDLPRDELDARQRDNLGVIMLHDSSRIDDLAIHVQRENGLRMRYHVLRAGVTTMLRDYLPQVTARLSCIWGAHDIYTIGNRSERIAAMRHSHPELRVAIIDDAGHWVMYERADEFNATLTDLLRP